MFDALASLLAFQLLGLNPQSGVGAAVHFFVMDVTKIFVLLVVIIYVMGLLRAMLTKGVALGTTLALMMSVAALSLPEMLILRKVLRWQALALFAAVLGIAFTLVGWAFNLVV